MKRIKQVRYYSENSENNYPATVTYHRLTSGACFNDFLPIVQLGVQALPGTKFYVNDSETPIIIGSTGIYELDLSGETQISSLYFAPTSIQNISDTNNAVLIVDMIYEGEEE